MTDPGNENTVKDILLANRDDFDYPVALSTTNEADIPGHYPYSPERKRIYVNGSRTFPEYESIPEFEDLVDGSLLKPQNAGDVVQLETAETFRYVVQYVIEWSLSLRLNQSLQAGEIFSVGFGDPDLENTTDNTLGPNADGWFVYQNGSMADDEAVIAEYRNGTAVDTKAVTLSQLFQTYGRIAGQTNWYNVGPTTVEETFTDDGTQQNPTLGAVSVDDGKGPQTANKSVTTAIKAEAGAGTLTAEVGSIGLRTLGDVEGIVRTKDFQIEEQTIDTLGTYVPLAALRVDTDRTLISTQISAVLPSNYTGGGDLKLVAFGVDPSKTDATGFSPPPELGATESVIEATTDVDEMPNSEGTQVVDPADPGGYQLGFGSLAAEKNTPTQGTGRVKKRLVANQDIAVIAAFVPNSGTTGELTFEIEIEEDW